MKKLLIAVLAVALCIGSVVCLTACNQGRTSVARCVDNAVYDEQYTAEHNKAMIFIPGLMASSYHDTEGDGQALWGYTGFVNLIKMGNEISKKYDAADDPDSLPYESYTDELTAYIENMLSCDDNGVPLKKLRVASMQDEDKYASYNGMMYMYKILEPLYSENYDFVVWQYDWRQDLDTSGAQLENFVNSCGYDKVMFFTHSMGGIVVSNWLQKAENRDKVELFMPFGAPMLGSMDAISNMFPSEGFSNMITNLMGLVGVNINLAKIARTLPSVVQLLPFAEFWDTPYYSGANKIADSPIYLDGEPVTFEEFYDYLCSRDWAKDEQGNVKSFIRDLRSYQERYFVTVDGEKKHVSELVNTFYVYGVDPKDDLTGELYGTTIAANLDTTNDTQLSEGSVKSLLGDGTVPAYSGTAGNRFDKVNCLKVTGVSHGPLGDPITETRITGLIYIADVVALFASGEDTREIAEPYAIALIVVLPTLAVAGAITAIEIISRKKRLAAAAKTDSADNGEKADSKTDETEPN